MNRWMTAVIALGATTLLQASGRAEDGGLGRRTAALDALFKAAQLDLRAPGLVYGVVTNGELAHIRSFGVRDREAGTPVTPRTAFRIASMTKMMTALLILDLQDQGRLLLDQPAEKYVPPMAAWTYPTADSRKVTIRDLLNHTAGFTTDNPWADRQMARTREEFDAFLERAEPFSHAPGTTYEYSNFGYALLGLIIERITGQTYGARLQERILEPLGMTGSGVDPAKIAERDRAKPYHYLDNRFVSEPPLGTGAFDAIGGLWTTAQDYARFMAWFLSAWPARDEPDPGPIPRRVIRSVTDGVVMTGTTRRPGLSGGDDCVMASGYGMGLGHSHHCDAGLILGHGGGFPGYGSYILFLPEKGMGVFAFSNKTYGRMYGPVWDAAIRLAKADIGKPRVPLPADRRLLAAYDGVVRAYKVGSLTAAGLSFADNFFMDRSEERWATQFTALREAAGTCRAAGPIRADGRFSGQFTWTCDKARVTGSLTMAPVDPSQIQALHLRVIQRGSRGRTLNTDFDFH
ncbi:MAG: serine hydrolase domain-containing protein [Alphaproteobacteria bacterium]